MRVYITYESVQTLEERPAGVGLLCHPAGDPEAPAPPALDPLWKLLE